MFKYDAVSAVDVCLGVAKYFLVTQIAVNGLDDAPDMGRLSAS